MDVTVRSEEFAAEDLSWLGSEHGEENGEPIELDLSLFDFVTDFPDGYIPSGVVLGKTTGGQYGPYADAGSDGLDVATGHLLRSQSVVVNGVADDAGVRPCAQFWHGRVIVDNLPTNHGLTTAARADLKLIRYVD